jgi:hypothetical protein
VTDVVRCAIDTYFRAVQDREHHALEVFEEVGFVGCAEGDPELSTRSGELVAEELETKHGDR